MSTEHLEPADLRRVVERYQRRLRRHRDQLNRLNVYPVPDGDTGTNMTLTVEAVLAAADGAVGMDELAEALAHGSLMGAQGNSGIILSQILRGFADAMRGRDRIGARELTAALTGASRAAYASVGSPAEGTILTVLRESAEEIADAVGGAAGLEAALRRGFDRGVRSLRDTPRLLPVLAEAGVVDAGGAGYVLLLAALLEEVSGAGVEVPAELMEAPAGAMTAEAGAGTGPRYEVMFLLEAGEEAGEALREAWRRVGESIVVVGGSGEWNCHVHTDDIGAALEAGIGAGRPHRIRVTDLFEQAAVAEFHEAPYRPLPAFATAEVGVVAVGIGAGVIALFRDAGAQAVVAGGQTMNPAVGVLLEAVEGVPASIVILLPNNENVIPAAEQVDLLTTKRVRVVPTRSVPQGLAAMLAYQPGDDADRIVEAMEAAAAGCRSVQLTRAVRPATTPIGAVAEGDWMGMVEGRVAVADTDAEAALLSALEDVVDENTEIVTIIAGADADPGVLAALEGWLGERHPGVAVDVHEGGQPLYPYLIGAE